MFSFHVGLPFSRMLPSFSNKCFLPFCVFVIQQHGTKVFQTIISFNFMCFGLQILFCVFLPFNRMTSKHVLPFCVYVIQQNGTQIIQAAIFSYFDFYHIIKPNFFKKGVLFCVFAIEQNCRKFFFVFLAFIGILIRFSDNIMEPILASSNVFLFYVFVI